MNQKSWIKYFIVTFLIMLVSTAGVVILVDPYMHYHKPLSNLFHYSFNSYEQRSINNGFLRQFDFDGLITGSSMTENFRASSAEALFGGSFAKLPNAGSTFKENRDLINEAMKYNEIKTVICCLDSDNFELEPDAVSAFYTDAPVWLYDDNPINDVKYLFNLDAIKAAASDIKQTIKSGPGLMDFDSYSAWYFESDIYLVLDKLKNMSPVNDQRNLSEEEKTIVRENMKSNISELARSNPDTEFYYFIPPYSILWYAEREASGNLEAFYEALEIGIDECLKNENVHLFLWPDEEFICDLSKYRDARHYYAEINNLMLQWIAEGKGLVTRENVTSQITRLKKFVRKRTGEYLSTSTHVKGK